jgi:hypothetical protein
MGEVATFPYGVTQFEGGESAFICVAFCAALIKGAGPPGGLPTLNAEGVDQLADMWYAKLEGSYAASNTNGMSLEAEHTMLDGLGLKWLDLGITATSSHDSDIANIKAALGKGYLVMMCGAEPAMHDVGLGDIVPYGWTPSGNHCVVASGISGDGNLFVRDMANVGHGLVPGSQRTYDASKLQLISGTAIIPSWIGEQTVTISLAIPEVANYFQLVNGNQWQCKKPSANGDYKIIHGDILKFYTTVGNAGLCGLSDLGLPLSNEVPLSTSPCTKQYFERGCLVYDPNHVLDRPPGITGTVYKAHVYDINAVGADPMVGILQKELAALKAIPPVVPPVPAQALVDAISAIKTINVELTHVSSDLSATLAKV